MAYNFKGAFEYYSGKTDKSESNPKTDLEKKNFLAHFLKRKGNLGLFGSEYFPAVEDAAKASLKGPVENAKVLDSFIAEKLSLKTFKVFMSGEAFETLVGAPKDSIIKELLPRGLKHAWNNHISLPNKIILVATYHIWNIENKRDTIKGIYTEFLKEEDVTKEQAVGGSGYSISYDASKGKLIFKGARSPSLEHTGVAFSTKTYNFRRTFNETFFTQDVLYEKGSIRVKTKAGPYSATTVSDADILINIYQSLPTIAEEAFRTVPGKTIYDPKIGGDAREHHLKKNQRTNRKTAIRYLKTFR